jgi:hypothetical protein
MRRLFVELPQERGDPVGVAQAFEDSTGLTVDRYLAICCAMLSRWMTSDHRADAWPLTYSYFQNTRVTEDEYDVVVNALAASPDELRRMFERERDAGRRGLFDLAPLAKRPLCRLDNDAIVPLDPPLLLERLIGDGVYWRLKSIFDHRAESDRFGAAVGDWLETHLREVAHETLDHGPVRVFDEAPYDTPDGPAKGPDLALWQAPLVTLVEIGATRCDYGRTILAGDLDAYRADIERVFVAEGGRARQLDKKVRALRDGRLAFQDVPADAAVLPLVVLLEGFPIVPLPADVPSAVRDARLLQQADVNPLVVMSAAEFEALCALVATEGFRVGELIFAWQATTPVQPFWAWASPFGTEALRPEGIERRGLAAFETWTRELGLPEIETSGGRS